MKQTILLAFLFTSSFAVAQVTDTSSVEDNIDYSAFGDAAGVKRYAPKKY